MLFDQMLTSGALKVPVKSRRTEPSSTSASNNPAGSEPNGYACTRSFRGFERRRAPKDLIYEFITTSNSGFCLLLLL